MEGYLKSTDIIDWKHPKIISAAAHLAFSRDRLKIAKACFEYVRDEIKHIDDYMISKVTCRASEVLEEGSGSCYAKSHLLAALLRGNGIPAGFCYQRLSRDDNGPPFCLHGFNGVYLEPFGWYRIDARGNREGVNAQFAPPREQLAFTVGMKGEADFPEIWPDPLPVVLKALDTYKIRESLWENLPDVEVLI